MVFVNTRALRLAILGGCLAACGSRGAVGGVTVYVAPDGNDSWSGLHPTAASDGSDGPLRSLGGARDAVRRLRTGGVANGPVDVVFADGDYVLNGAVTFLPEDGGTETAPVRYLAAPGARPVFSGGRRLHGFQVGGDGLWRLSLPDVAAGGWYFEQLWVDGVRATRAREPDGEPAALGGATEVALGPLFASGQATLARDTITLGAGAVAPLAALSSSELADVELVALHKWDTTVRHVEHVDTTAGSIDVVGVGMKPWNPLDAASVYRLENFASALDIPGEWFLARDGTLTYWPLPGQDPDTTEVVAPITGSFLEIRGDAEAGGFVEWMTFAGLAFRYAQWSSPPGGFGPIQGAASLEATITLDGARHVTIERCEIGHVGLFAVWFRHAVTASSIRECDLHDLGAGGVRAGELDIVDAPLQTGHIVVDNNLIREGGRLIPSAAAILVGQSGNNEITHNEIVDHFYTGVSLGWSRDYDASAALGNLVADNHIHHLGWGRMSDLGGVYTLGVSTGTIIRGNRIHDVRAREYGGIGLYNDQATSGIVMRDNLVYATDDGYDIHYGSDNVVDNNIFAFGREYQLGLTQAEAHRSVTLTHNLILSGGASLLSGPWASADAAFTDNVYYGGGDFAGYSFAQWTALGRDTGSVLADPGFTDAARGDFTLRDDTAALSVGFVPFDTTSAGLYGDAAWTGRAAAVTRSLPPARLP